MSMSEAFTWNLPNAFTTQLTVQQQDTDRLGHTNNVSYLRWLEAIAWEHMESLNCGWHVNEKTGKAMAIIHTEIDYLAASYAKESLVLGTWITSSDLRFQSERQFQLFRASDKKLLLTALMRFVCIDLKTGKACKMSTELVSAHTQALKAIGR